MPESFVSLPRIPPYCVLARFKDRNLPGGPPGGGEGIGLIWAPFFQRIEYIFVYCKWRTACNGVFKGGSIGKTICQPFCKNACLLSSSSLLFFSVRLDSIRLWFSLPCVGDRIWQDDVRNIQNQAATGSRKKDEALWRIGKLSAFLTVSQLFIQNHTYRQFIELDTWLLSFLHFLFGNVYVSVMFDS